MTIRIQCDNVIPLGGDKRCETLYNCLLDVIFERGEGIPLPAVLGTLTLLQRRLIDSVAE